MEEKEWKILAPVKRVVDYNVKVCVKSDNTGVDIANVKISMNPFDEIAVEDAVRLKKVGVATQVVAVSVGRGLGIGENYTTVLEPLADTLQAALGASRAADGAG